MELAVVRYNLTREQRYELHETRVMRTRLGYDSYQSWQVSGLCPILNDLNGKVVQNGGCGRTPRKVKSLLHSATGRQLILPLNERSDVTLQGVSRAVQPDQRAAVRITRDTCYADSSGI